MYSTMSYATLLLEPPHKAFRTSDLKHLAPSVVVTSKILFRLSSRSWAELHWEQEEEEEEELLRQKHMPRYGFLVLDEAIQPFELGQMVFQLLLCFPDVRKLTLEVPSQASHVASLKPPSPEVPRPRHSTESSKSERF